MSEKPTSGIAISDDGKPRCMFANTDLYRPYHDTEWGHPSADDTYIYESICLEGFQAGLSWSTILRKRENFRDAFQGFDYNVVAEFEKHDVDRLVQNPGIVRHRRKIMSVINNAHRAIELRREFGSLAAFVWQFEPPPENRPATLDRRTVLGLTKTEESTALSKALKKRGWSFVGPTSMYAFMQAVGIVNDHIEGCAFRCRCDQARKAFVVPKRKIGQ